MTLPLLSDSLNAMIAERLSPWWQDEEAFTSEWDEIYRGLWLALRMIRKPYNEIVAPHDQPPDGAFVLYFHMDHDGSPIYVGKSRRVDTRQREHRKYSRWWNEIAYMEFELLPDQASLDVAELVAIRRFQPTYNIADNPRTGR